MDNNVYEYIDVIFPLALDKALTYKIPPHLQGKVKPGIRVEVKLRSKNYSAIVLRFNPQQKFEYRISHILSVLDDEPIVNEYQLKFWDWIASYYCSNLGEVMHLSLPSGLKLSSETKFIKSNIDTDQIELDDDEYLITEALSIRNKITIEDARLILNKKTIYPVVRSLLEKNVLTIEEELIEKYQEKKIRVARWHSNFSDENSRNQVWEEISNSIHQTNALLAFAQLSRKQKLVPTSDIQNLANVKSTVISRLVAKEILTVEEMVVSRLEEYNSEISEEITLSEEQQGAVDSIENLIMDNQKNILLHGVTGSGKTLVYTELIKKEISKGQQVLFLLPEIALTTQIVKRLEHIFGSDMAVYHSRMSNNQRVEVYKSVLLGKKIILGARSALFLPFVNLGLIIIDEEHDSSYKQIDPSPRYNARDSALVLARLHSASVILGSATPSVESYLNAHNNKYGYVQLNNRYGMAQLPQIELVDLRKAFQTGRIKSFFSNELIEEINQCLESGKQIIIFQNRRGYAPSLICTSCGWTPFCKNCDVQMTMHLYNNELKCHYCGYRYEIPRACKACGGVEFKDVGFGTEKIEEKIQEVVPSAKPLRLDYDTAKTKSSFEKIINDFSSKNFNVLIGTQMITKGLDFENVALVAVLNADAIISQPNFKSSERAFQLLTQVSGRSGRRDETGKVLIQTFTPHHDILTDVINHDYDTFIKRELSERKSFIYPPFYRIIELEIKHNKLEIASEVAETLSRNLKKKLGGRIIGPTPNYIPKIKNKYIFNLLVKYERSPAQVATSIKEEILSEIAQIKTTKSLKNVRININVDP